MQSASAHSISIEMSSGSFANRSIYLRIFRYVAILFPGSKDLHDGNLPHDRPWVLAKLSELIEIIHRKCKF